MKKIAFTITAVILSFGLFAQDGQHEAFKKDKELKSALAKYDLRAFIDKPVTFIYDTLEKKVSAIQLNALIKKYMPSVKNAVLKKASETNNGYVQSFGLYKNDDALYYIRFTINPLAGTLEEVMIEKNN